MFYVYILQSTAFPREVYTGFSENIDSRVNDHNSGKSVHTAKFAPWKLLWYAAFPKKEQALAFERYLKTSSGIAFRNKRLVS
jgi:putative endonuclease